MAEGIALNVVKGVLDKLHSTLSNEIGLLQSFKDDVEDLESNFSAIRAVLYDAEERSDVEKMTHALCDWLCKLKDAAYDADDLLNEIRTQAARQQREVQNQNQVARKICEFLSCANPMHLKFKLKMAHQMKAIRARINKIAIERFNFGLVEAGSPRQAEFERPKTVSAIDEQKALGRDDDKEKIVKLLLETNGDHNVSVIPIVGLGGLGKTTLAQLAFKDRRIADQQHFDLRVWVCVSTDFDMKTIAKPVTSAAGEKCDDLDNQDAVAGCLMRIFSQKRFLLALDDVWNEDQEKWENLKVLFKDGKKGSKILVTTRSEKVTEIMKTTEQPHRLKGLSDADCWTLFKRRAFKDGEENDYPHLVEIGKQIVKKCCGVPLAANSLGSMMRFKSRTEVAWLAIRDNEIWRLEQEGTILQSLKLSYIQMSSALKQCFAYCSIFPKDYEIDKEDLILQWIALGFISSPDTRISMEDIGNGYFDELLWMSFLQQVRKDWKSEKIICRMHDLVHDLAQSVAGEEVAVTVGEESKPIPEGCRYASIHGHFIPQIPTTVVRRLRALHLSGSAPLMTFYSKAKRLRLLDLHDSEISMLPSSIGKLKFLRYLNLSSTDIRELPKPITNLCNLQTLKVLGCHEIRTLPKSLGRLANLQILDLSGCRSVTVPDSISNLQNLYALNLSNCQKVISLGPTSLEPICHLKNLHYLDLSYLGSLVTLPECIGSLENLHILNLSHCQYLLLLPLSLCHLKNLQYLNLSYLGSLRALPESIGSLENLRILNLSNCVSLLSLSSSLCRLKNLRDLNLSCLNSLETLYESIGSLQNLHILNLSYCSSLLSLPSSSSDLRHLEILDINGCKKLHELPKMIQKLTKLGKLLNEDCLELKAMPRGIGKLVSLQKLPFFVIGKQDCIEHRASISELEHLKLVDKLEIKGLENVTSPIDAKAANLIEKDLWFLKLEWNVLSTVEDIDIVLQTEEIDTVLENLQPRQNLEYLRIEGYAGRKFPSWMMNRIVSCLPNLVEIKLLNIPRCSSLPLLGQLSFLENLTFQDMPAITNFGVEFYGDCHIASANKFPALTTLFLGGMPVLREWVTVLTVDDKEGRRERVPIIPRLTELTLLKCPQLRPEPCLPASVENLTISGTSKENLSLILERATMDSESSPDDGNAVSLQQSDKGLRRLTIRECQQVSCLPESLRSLTSLQWLTISGCEDLERIEDWLGELTELQSLFIGPCNSLRYLPAHKMTTLKELYIDDCLPLFDADGRFVDTTVDHINEVYVNARRYPYERVVSRLWEEIFEENCPEKQRFLESRYLLKTTT